MARTHKRVRPSAKAVFLLNNTDRLISALRDIPCDSEDAKTITDAIDTIEALQRQAHSFARMMHNAQKRVGRIEFHLKRDPRFKYGFRRSFCKRT